MFKNPVAAKIMNYPGEYAIHGPDYFHFRIWRKLLQQNSSLNPLRIKSHLKERLVYIWYETAHLKVFSVQSMHSAKFSEQLPTLYLLSIEPSLYSWFFTVETRIDMHLSRFLLLTSLL